MCVMSPTKGKIGWLTYCHHQKLLGSDAKCAKSMIRFKCLKVVDTHWHGYVFQYVLGPPRVLVVARFCDN